MASLPPPTKATHASKLGTIYQQKPEDISMVAWQRIAWANMSYRDDSSQTWTHLDASFVPMWAKDYHPEPASVQEVQISWKGIRLRQYDAEYIPEWPQREVGRVRQAQSGWEVVIALDKIYDVVISEYKASWVETQREERAFCIIRFKCRGIKASRDISRKEEDEEEAELASVHDEGEDDDDAIAKSGDEDDDRASVSDEGESENDVAGDEMDPGTSPAEYPLARLCQDPNALVGKEIRLAFLKRTNKRSPYKWIWPAAITHLLGERYKKRPNNEKMYTMPLNDWVRQTRKWPPATHLTEVGVYGGVEWKLNSAPRPAALPPAGQTAALPPTGQPVALSWGGRLAASARQKAPVSAKRQLAEESDAEIDARLALAQKDVLEKITATQASKAAYSAAQKAETQAKKDLFALQEEKTAREARD